MKKIILAQIIAFFIIIIVTYKIKDSSIEEKGEWNGTVNEPIIEENGMKAITYDSDGKAIEVKDKSKWYSYDTIDKKWANAQTEDGSYWVWIPRYEYKITYTDPSDYSQGGTIDINFIPTSQIVATDGYKIHPAFQNGMETNYKNGEWDKELSGIWVAKYEMSPENCEIEENQWNFGIGTFELNTEITEENKTKLRVVSKPGVETWKSIQWGNCYANAYTYNRSLESHLMKNSEWGAIAYLTYSKYGLNGVEPVQNITTKTGGSLGATAISNPNQSSTGNAYGIYDLIGGIWEYTAGYISNGYKDSYYLSNYGKSTTSEILYVKTISDEKYYQTGSKKYLTVYPYNSLNDTSENNYIIYKNEEYGYGDAILEISSKRRRFNKLE